MALDKYDFEKLADEISKDYLDKKVPINRSIKIVSIKMELNPEQIKRLTEFSNISTYNKMFNKEDDKTFEFELGDSQKVIDDIYNKKEEVKEDLKDKIEGEKIEGGTEIKSNESGVYTDKKDEGKETVIEIKKMPDIQYSEYMEPDKMENSTQILGDNNEASVAKNTANKEDAASDEIIDALKVPEKDYSSHYSDETEGIDDTPKEEMRKYDTKTASQIEYENQEGKFAAQDISRELESRLYLEEDNKEIETRKLASHFVGVYSKEQFPIFEKVAKFLYKNSPYLGSILNETARLSNNCINASEEGNLKVASENTIGIKQLGKVIAIYDKIANINNTIKYLETVKTK